MVLERCLFYNHLMIAVKDFISILEQWAPLELAESWDNVGLQIGGKDLPVSEVVIAMDADDSVLSYLHGKKYVFVITHHPLFFKPISQLLYDQDMGRVIQTFIQGQHSLYSAHTNLDAATGGVNDSLILQYGLEPEKGTLIQRNFGRYFTGLQLAFSDLLTVVPCKREGSVLDDDCHSIAFCCGRGHGFIQDVIDLGCDTLVTGEINYHDHLKCQMNGVRVLSLGHKESEVFVLPKIKARLLDFFPELTCTVL